MTAKEYLDQLKPLEYKIQHRQEQLTELRERMLSLSSPQADSDQVQTSHEGGTVERDVIKCISMEQRVNRLMTRAITKRGEIIDKIHGLTDARYIEILYERYIRHEKFQDIADSMNYSERQILTLHKQAVIAFYDRWKKTLHLSAIW